jgi:multicomponent Na+:H+ antiporter subunit G
MSDVLGMVLIGIGLFFDLLGCIGLVRMPDLYNRLQASTKCVTFGTCSILAGVFVMTGFTSTGIKALLCMVFIGLTAPVAAHALARAAHRSGLRLCKGSVADAYETDCGKTGKGSGDAA